MKKLLLFALATSILACNETPKNYATFSGKISNKKSDSIVVLSRTFSKTINVNEDGTFKDTLKIEPGVYRFHDGNKAASVFLKNGFDLKVNLDANEFNSSLTFEGDGAVDNNFLIETSKLQEDIIDLDAMANLDMASLDKEFASIENKLNEHWQSNPQIDTVLTNEFKNNITPMLSYYKKHVSETIALKAELPKGAPSPDFSDYENYKGGTTSLADLKGKYVYVDVWATWCGPCKAEIPSLKKLEEAYHGKNIHFVSMSVDDDRSHGGSWDKAREDWKAMVADKELSGIQIFAPKGWQSEFVQNYRIKGIPRFILIDPNGNIVTPDAPRPSSDKLIELFDSLEI
ncbi:TlpA family protein disulfide reductase [Gaetbulibacter saemankumensis]|uniref:TlpA family protein disulfide reductase n=1 Tax=Gaetbulibacter saemankumensis TaxID=311208 RepID=UPI00041B6D76|nr:TlpA disulfide reductase family protein [Gaetbulibacter saemankumensis]